MAYMFHCRKLQKEEVMEVKDMNVLIFRRRLKRNIRLFVTPHGRYPQGFLFYVILLFAIGK